MKIKIHNPSDDIKISLIQEEQYAVINIVYDTKYVYYSDDSYLGFIFIIPEGESYNPEETKYTSIEIVDYGKYSSWSAYRANKETEEYIFLRNIYSACISHGLKLKAKNAASR